MIEIRLRAAGANPSSRPWRWALSILVAVVGVVAPVATSRAQDASVRAKAVEVDGLHALKVVTIDGGESVAITSGASSITLRKDGTVIIKGSEIVIDNGKGPVSSKPTSVASPASMQGSPCFSNTKSEIF